MIALNDNQLELIEQAALADYPNEMCGLLTKDGFIHTANLSDSPDKGFRISARDYAVHHSDTIAVIHTHIPDRLAQVFDVRTPSYQDLIEQKRMGIPWLIFGCDGHNLSTPLQVPRVPNSQYLDRPFIWYVNDCYSLVQDYYRFELGIVLPDHKATKAFTEITRLNDLFSEHISDYRFTTHDTLDDLNNGDLLLLDNAGFKRNHLGIVHDGQVLHQGALSVMQPFSDFIGRINQVLKYENQCHQEP
jgi:proteasome lid subunit RPN8/RPN11